MVANTESTSCIDATTNPYDYINYTNVCKHLTNQTLVYNTEPNVFTDANIQSFGNVKHTMISNT